MPKYASEGIREGLMTMSALQGQRQQRAQQQLQNQLMIADLAEKGYDYTPGQEGFMGIGGKPAQLTPNGNVSLSRQLQQAQLNQLLRAPKYEPTTFEEAVKLREAGRQNVTVNTAGGYDPNYVQPEGVQTSQQPTETQDYEGQLADGYNEGEIVDDIAEDGTLIGSYQVVNGILKRVQ